MSKVMTFSQAYPEYHPIAGEPTLFVEKLWLGLNHSGLISASRLCELSRETGIGGFDMNNIRKCELEPKFHTIRAGKRWKAGDKLSPRVWRGKAYQKAKDENGKIIEKTKENPTPSQIIICHDIEVKKVWDFSIRENIFDGGNQICIEGRPLSELEIWQVAKNDGLSVEDFLAWFKFPKPFEGQIICFSEKIEYA